MKNSTPNYSVTTAAFLLSAVFVTNVFAHESGVVPIDAGGNNPNATDLASVSCYDDGNGTADRLFVQIEDVSPPVAGLLLSVQIAKGLQMTNVTDTVSGDGNKSQAIELKGGNGAYAISVNKTNKGIRYFNVTYHCLTASNAHTGTDIVVYQAQ